MSNGPSNGLSYGPGGRIAVYGEGPPAGIALVPVRLAMRSCVRAQHGTCSSGADTIKPDALARLPPQTGEAYTAPLPGTSLPGAFNPSQPRTFTQETTFGNLAQL